MNAAEVPDDELAALLALASLPGVGPAALTAWLEAGAAASAWRAARRGRTSSDALLASIVRRSKGDQTIVRVAAEIDAPELLHRHRAAGISILVVGRPGYPERLQGDPAPPAVLFVDGSLDPLAAPVVAIVGTRNATRLGRDTVGELAVDLARLGVTVASGLALGIDGAAHAAIAPEEPRPGVVGRPIAVVAAGLDHRYPRAHRALHERVARRGAVVSEVPMGVGPSRWRFPARNRILAGLADAVVVVESRSAGGSMHTVAEALARDVPVLAVPGHPTSPAAAGTLDLICDGAAPVRDAEDVLLAIGMGGASTSALAAVGGTVCGGPGPGHGEREEAHRTAILARLDRGPATLAELVASAEAPIDEVSGSLVHLELDGAVVRSGTWFERTAGGPAASRRSVR